MTFSGGSGRYHVKDWSIQYKDSFEHYPDIANHRAVTPNQITLRRDKVSCPADLQPCAEIELELADSAGNTQNLTLPIY